MFLYFHSLFGLWCCATKRLQHIPICDFHVGVDPVNPVSAAHNLSAFMDGELSMRSHIAHVAASCFGVMR